MLANRRAFHPVLRIAHENDHAGSSTRPRASRLRWYKHRWSCPDERFGIGSWTGEDDQIALAHLSFTDRAGR